MKRIIRATTSPEITQREIENRALARRICAEGIVLLKNEGALPLQGKKVALYGLGARKPNIGGVGSGETRPREIVNIEKGFLNAGLEITSKNWLNDYDAEYEQKYATWRAQLTEGLKKCPKLEQMDYANQHLFQFPEGRDITPKDWVNSDTDTAVYILTRQAGEGADRQVVAGDYLITETELRHLQSLCSHYKWVVLVLNVGGLMDLSFAETLPISGIVHFTQGGMESGNALADVLTGKVTPCGKLVDTWAARYEDYPCYDTYSYRNNNINEEDYNEGIYVGYRYFDSFGVKPLYPFGYGLSYTSFSLGTATVKANGTKITATIPVTNTGSQYTGKEVIQAYISAPCGKLPKEYQRLVSFVKTKALAPGETETLSLAFDMAECSSFSETDSAWLLEKGNYLLRIGTSSVDTAVAARLHMDTTVITEQVEHICPLQKELELYKAPDRSQEESDAPVVAIDCAAFRILKHNYTKAKPIHNAEVDRLMASLSLEDLTKLVVGAGFIGAVYNTTFGAIGKTTSVLVKKGIQNLNMCDGPQGLNLIQRSLKPRQNFITVPALPETLEYGMNKKIFDRMKPKENDRRTVYYQFCTSWPCETMVAQTWDVDLAEKLGYATGREMMETGITLWLAPGLNIHRNVLCGRNFEYYSEDPLLTGKLGAAVVRGAQQHKGCYATPKHFACNNQESGRQQVSSNVDERTLREIYLKAFAITVREADPKALMSSYNRINGTYAPNNYDLLTKVLRNEWGFTGIVMTDWYATGKDNAKDELCAAAGNDLVMPGGSNASKAILNAVKTGVVDKADLERCARNVLNATLQSNMYIK